MKSKRTFSKLINKKLKANNPIELENLLNAQIKLRLKIPPDYCYLLQNSNGYCWDKGFEITLNKANPIVEINDFVNLEWLVKEREYDLDNDDAKIYRDKFLRIAGCYNQDRVLMGYSEEVLNEIHLYDYDNDKTVKICNSIFEFINDYLKEI